MGADHQYTTPEILSQSSRYNRRFSPSGTPPSYTISLLYPSNRITVCAACDPVLYIDKGSLQAYNEFSNHDSQMEAGWELNTVSECRRHEVTGFVSDRI